MRNLDHSVLYNCDSRTSQSGYSVLTKNTRFLGWITGWTRNYHGVWNGFNVYLLRCSHWKFIVENIPFSNDGRTVVGNMETSASVRWLKTFQLENTDNRDSRSSPNLVTRERSGMSPETTSGVWENVNKTQKHRLGEYRMNAASKFVFTGNFERAFTSLPCKNSISARNKNI
jgi:hypothetical protein